MSYCDKSLLADNAGTSREGKSVIRPERLRSLRCPEKDIRTYCNVGLRVREQKHL